MSNILDEKDIRELFQSDQSMLYPTPVDQTIPSGQSFAANKVYSPEKFTWKTFIEFTIIFIGIFIISYLFINFQAIFIKSRYLWDVNIQNGSYSKAVPAPSPHSFSPSSQAKLIIPKIGVNAPIYWNVEENKINETLLKGVVHSKGTALPGSLGNVFITGHSSYYSWVNSDYKTVFSLLDKVQKKDIIYIEYSDTIFEYEVYDSKVVNPSDLSVLEQPKSYELSLMTCVPVGTNINRLVVKAKQIKP